MKSAGGLRENFTSLTAQTWQVVFTETSTKRQFIALENIPDVDLANCLVEALQSYSPDRHKGQFNNSQNLAQQDNVILPVLAA